MKKQLSGMALALSLAAQSALAAPDETVIPLPPSPLKNTVSVGAGYWIESSQAIFTGLGSTNDAETPVVTRTADGRYKVSVKAPDNITLQCDLASGPNNKPELTGSYSRVEVFNQGATQQHLWSLDGYTVFMRTAQNGSGNFVQVEMIDPNNRTNAVQCPYGGSVSQNAGLTGTCVTIVPMAPFSALQPVIDATRTGCVKLWNNPYLLDTKQNPPQLYALKDIATTDDLNPDIQNQIFAGRRVWLNRLRAAAGPSPGTPAP